MYGIEAESQILSNDPACHSYLGNDLEEVKKRNFLNDKEPQILLLLAMRDIVLFPGETLPLRIRIPSIIHAIRKLFEQKVDAYGQVREEVHHLGVVNSATVYGAVSSIIGTSIEIRTKSKESLLAVNGDDDEIILTCKGRRRFQVIKVNNVGNVAYASVWLLPDTVPSSGLYRSLPHALKTFPKWVSTCNSPSTLAKTAYNLFCKALTTQGGSDNLLYRWGPDSSQEHEDRSLGVPCRAERDPVGFSFFLAANMSVSTKDLQSLLEARDAVDRLRLAISFLVRAADKSLACQRCSQVLAPRSQVFTLPGAEGMVGAYVNPHGAVHQTITVRALSDSRAVLLEGEPEAQDSWFPGYAWTIAYCSQCALHLGWRFTVAGAGAEDEDNEDNEENEAGDDDSAEWSDLEEDEEQQSEEEQVEDGSFGTVSSGSDEWPEEDSSDFHSVGANSGDGERSVGHGRDMTAVWRSSVVEDIGLMQRLLQLGAASEGREPPTGPTDLTSTVSPHSPSRVTEFWGLRRAALKEV